MPWSSIEVSCVDAEKRRRAGTVRLQAPGISRRSSPDKPQRFDVIARSAAECHDDAPDLRATPPSLDFEAISRVLRLSIAARRQHHQEVVGILPASTVIFHFYDMPALYFLD